MEVVGNSKSVEKMGKVEKWVIIGICTDTEVVPLVAERMWERLISEKVCWGIKVSKLLPAD